MIDTFVLFKQMPLWKYQFNLASIFYPCILCHSLTPWMKRNIQTSSIARISEESKHDHQLFGNAVDMPLSFCDIYLIVGFISWNYVKTYWSPLELSMVVLIGSFVCSQEISEAPSQTPVSLAAQKKRELQVHCGRPIQPIQQTKDFGHLAFFAPLIFGKIFMCQILQQWNYVAKHGHFFGAV